MAGSKRNIERVAWDKLAEYIRPLLPGIGGVNKIIYVDANRTGATNVNSGGTPENPKATIAGALTDCTTNVGDIVIVAAEHTETIDADGDLDVTKNDVKIIGLGEGDNRPLLTISTVVGANITISGSGVVFANMRISMEIDACTAPIVVSGNGCVVKDIQYIEASACEAIDIFTFTGDRHVVDNVRIYGRATGDGDALSAIHLAGCDDMVIRNCHVWGGDWGDGLIQNETTTCTNIIIDGCTFETEATENIITAWLANASGVMRNCTAHLGGAGAVVELENCFGGNVARLIILDNVRVARVDGGVTVNLSGTGAAPVVTGTAPSNEQHWYVDSVNGHVNNSGMSWEDPVALINTAIDKCTTAVPSVIHVSAAHAETLADATTLVPDLADITIIGEGSGDNRATLTMSAAGSSIIVSGAGVRIENLIITTTGVIDVTAAIDVRAAGVVLKDIEFRESGATSEFAICVLTTNAADRLVCDNVRYIGFVDGNGNTDCIKVVGGATDVIIKNCYFHGTTSVAMVDVTNAAASLGVLVDNCVFYNGHASAIGLALLFNTTVHASTRYYLRDCFDGKQGVWFTGSYDHPLTCIKDTWIQVTKSGAGATANDDLFTIAGGPCRVKFYGLTSATLERAAGVVTFKYNFDATGGAAGDFDFNAVAAGYSSDIRNATVPGGTSLLTPPAAIASNILVSDRTVQDMVLPPGVIEHTLGVAADAGTIEYVLYYQPLVNGASVVAAA